MLKQFLVAFTAVTTFYVLFAPIRAPIALIFALGAGVACLYIQRRHTSQNHFEEMSSRIYGVDHGILNIDLPLQTMWMNMGYWKVCFLLCLENTTAAMVRRSRTLKAFPKPVKAFYHGFSTPRPCDGLTVCCLLT